MRVMGDVVGTKRKREEEREREEAEEGRGRIYLLNIKVLRVMVRV